MIRFEDKFDLNLLTVRTQKFCKDYNVETFKDILNIDFKVRYAMKIPAVLSIYGVNYYNMSRIKIDFEETFNFKL